MIFVVPELTAVTTPVAFTVATDVFELLHVPPPVPLLLYCAVAPAQSGEVPVTVPAVTFGFTVRTADEVAVLQLPVMVKMIFVVPALTVVTTPELFTVATEVFELLHDPPEVPLLLY